jgi:hypothetical protein
MKLRFKLWLDKLMRGLGYVPVAKLAEAETITRQDLDKIEKQNWAKYMNRLQNDVHTSLSWFYSEHTKRVSLGIAPPSIAAEQWPYFPAAKQLKEKPVIFPERV